MKQFEAGSDLCVYKTGVALAGEGVTGYVVKNGAHETEIPVSGLRCRIINPARDLITFFTTGADGLLSSKTYRMSKIDGITTITRGSSVIKAVEEILRR